MRSASKLSSMVIAVTVTLSLAGAASAATLAEEGMEPGATGDFVTETPSMTRSLLSFSGPVEAMVVGLNAGLQRFVGGPGSAASTKADFRLTVTEDNPLHVMFSLSGLLTPQLATRPVAAKTASGADEAPVRQTSIRLSAPEYGLVAFGAFGLLVALAAGGKRRSKVRRRRTTA